MWKTSAVIAIVSLNILFGHQATALSLDPPADPVVAGPAVLVYERSVSVPRLTAPGSFAITERVRNVGGSAATNVTIVQQLPTGWTVNGSSTLRVVFDSIATGVTETATSTITVAATSAVGRFPNESILTANGHDSLEGMAAIDITKAAVLGATTLPETGSPFAILFVLGGGALAGLGALVRRT